MDFYYWVVIEVVLDIFWVFFLFEFYIFLVYVVRVVSVWLFFLYLCLGKYYSIYKKLYILIIIILKIFNVFICKIFSEFYLKLNYENKNKLYLFSRDMFVKGFDSVFIVFVVRVRY